MVPTQQQIHHQSNGIKFDEDEEKEQKLSGVLRTCFQPKTNQQISKQLNDLKSALSQQYHKSCSCTFICLLIIIITSSMFFFNFAYEQYTVNNWLMNTITDQLFGLQVGTFFNRSYALIQPSNKIIGLELIANKQALQQLPFCVIIPRIPSLSILMVQQIRNSLKQLNYTNFYQVFVQQQQIQNKLKNGGYNLNYYDYQQLIRKKCPKFSPVLFTTYPLKQNSLRYLNSQFQTYDSWLLYSKSQNNQIYNFISFYSRIYELIGNIKISGSNSRYLYYANKLVMRETISITLMQLCPEHMLEINIQQIFKQYQIGSNSNSLPSPDQKQSQIHSFYWIDRKKTQYYQRNFYMRLTKLSQDYPLNENYYQNYKYNYLTKQQVNTGIKAELSQQMMKSAMQRQQIQYLPANHSISRIQLIDYCNKYNIHKYASVQKQIPFCVTVLSRNNIQNGRYEKVIMSILQQNYTNYRIVFIDDNSTDETLNRTFRVLNKNNFIGLNQKGRKKAVFIKNKQHMFATYNIINAAFNYCYEDEVQLLIDGDDQLIGKQVFSVFNAAYQNNSDIWMVYSNYKDSQYKYGRSSRLTDEQQHNKNGKRQYDTGVGAIRTWKIPLIRQIPLSYHKKKNGNWFDTVYDDALAHPLMQLATVSRILYIPQILYQYTRSHGNNDDSSLKKIWHRMDDYQQVLAMKTLNKLQKLDPEFQNLQLQSILKKDENSKYVQITNIDSV